MEESSCVNVELCRSDTTEELETPQSLISALIELQLIKSLFHIYPHLKKNPFITGCFIESIILHHWY